VSIQRNQWYRYNSTDQILTYKRSGKTVDNPIQEKIYFSDEVVDAFTLEPKNKVPFDQNYTVIPNYFLDYWGYLLGVDASYTWIRYVRYVYRTGFEPTMTIAKMAKFMDISRNTLKKYISILEAFGFLAVFYKDAKVTEGNRERVDTSIRVKVRKSIPILHPDLVEQLPVELQRYHARDIVEMEKSMSIVNEELKGVDEIFGLNKSSDLPGGQNLTAENEGLSTACQNLTTENTKIVIHTPSKIDTHPHQNLTPLEYQGKELYLNININDFWNTFLLRLRTEISEVALNNFFMKINPSIESYDLVLSSTNPFAINWIQERYSDLVKEIVLDVEPVIRSIKYRS